MKNINFKKTLIRMTSATHTYQIENYEGMTKEEIIDACDFNNFGGSVNGNIAQVYVD